MSSTLLQHRYGSVLLSIFVLILNICVCVSENDTATTSVTSSTVSVITASLTSTTLSPLAAPTELDVNCTSTCTVSWKSSASFHRVVLSSGGENVKNYTPTENSHDLDVVPGTSYTVKVYSLQSAEEAISNRPSAEKNFTAPPSQPVNFTVSEAFSTREITLNWVHGSGVRDNYVLTCNPDICSGAVIDKQMTIKVVTGKWGENYTFTLKAVSNGVNSTDATVTAQLDLAIPTNLKLLPNHDMDATEFVLNWDPVKPDEARFDEYVVEKTARSKTPPTIEFNTANTSYTDNQVEAGGSYRYIVKTRLGQRKSNLSNKQLFVIEPSAPMNISRADPVGSKTATIIWDHGIGLRRSDDPYTANVSDGNASQNITNNMLSLTGLLPDTDYNVTITAWSLQNLVDDNVKSKSAAPFTFTTDEASPTNVTNVRTEPDTNSTEICWSRPQSRNGYIQRYVVKALSEGSCVSGVVIKCNANCPPAKQNAHYDNFNVDNCSTKLNETYDYDTNEISTNLMGLRPYTDYNYNILAVNSKDPSIKTGTFKTKQSAPLTAPELSLNSSTYNSLTVMWTLLENAGGQITNYYLEYYPVNKKTDVKNITAHRNETIAELPDLKSYTNYSVRIRAASMPNGTEALGAWSRDYTFLTGEYFPSAPVFNKEDINDDAVSITLNWSLPEDRNGVIQEYRVMYQIAGNDSFQKQLVETKLTAVLVENIKPYTNYTISLSARTNYSESEKKWGDSKTLTYETDQSKPGEVNSLKVNTITSTSLTLKWNPPTERNGIITAYKIECIRGNGCTEVPPLNPNMQTHTIENLKPNNAYTVRVAAQVRNRAGQNLTGNWSVKSGVRTNESAPTVILNAPTIQPITESIEARSFQFVFPPIGSLFSESNGKIVEYQIVVFKTESSSSIVSVPKDATLNTWGQIRQSNALSTKPYTPFGKRNVTSSRRKRSTSVTFKLGDEDCEGKLKDEVCNGPLDPESNYCVYARAWTSAGSSDSGCFVRATTPKDDTTLIVGLVVGLSVVMLIIIVLIVLWRRGKISPSTCKDVENSNDQQLVPVHENRPETPPPNAINIQDFIDHVGTMHRDQDFRFSHEYTRLKEMSPHHEQIAAVSHGNNSKNRWVDILPFDHSRVKLLPADEEEGSDYINANYMPGYTSRREYIATQGPLPGTIDHFWRMVWEQNVSMIVMLTQLMERGRRKCEQYWPEDIDEACTYGDLTVTKKTESVLPEYTIRIFSVQHNDIQRTVKQFFVSFWPDFGCPDRTGSLLNLVRVVRSHLSSDSKGPMLIHCSAGVGRTGTYIAVDRLLQHIQEHDDIDIFNLVLEMRDFRSRMVQTEDQYIYIHDCLRDALMSGMSRRFQPVIAGQQDEPQMGDEPIYQNTTNGTGDRASLNDVNLKADGKETDF